MADIAQVSATPRASRSALRLWPLFVLVGVLLYGALYVWSEALVMSHAERNRFFKVATAPLAEYDFVVLGASHALPLDYDDFNARLQQASGASVMNLANEGAGVAPNHLMLDYFLQGHRARKVIFLVDSFAFYSAQWNEDRLDSGLLARAPFDPKLVATLWRYPWAREDILPYVTGFTKVNNQDRFAPDRTDAELSKFDKAYRPVPQIDKQRIAYLYPPEIDPALFQRYLGELEATIDMVERQGGQFVFLKPPTPARYRDALPNEAQFDTAITQLAARRGISYGNFSTLLPGDENYYDTDHLNRTGVTAFMESGLVEFLIEQRAAP